MVMSLFLVMFNSKRMYMYINGPGGDLTPSMAIYDTMQACKVRLAPTLWVMLIILLAFFLQLEKRDYLFKELAEKTGQPVEQVCYKFLSLKHFKCVYVLLFIITTKFALSKH
ncbi:putative endopeptidase Clp [Helianthus annuus]|nr:putative endopeptidase Clp [Helianthus annuus]